MKMVKSLLLGSAAGLVAVSAGQAADLPVKAKPVEYVKVCSLYGAGFYYMPGTDICIKIGGYVRAEITDFTNGNLTSGPFNANLNQRATNNLTARARGYITADARDQSAYGTIRSYIAVGLASSDIGTSASESPVGTYANRAFIQWAGITAGLSQSFYDFYSAAALNYRAGFMNSQDTGDGGWWIWGYTAQFGNGVSATISGEMRRMNQIINQTGTTTLGVGTISGTTTGGAGYGGWQSPDIVGNIRIDQAWGSGQIMAVAHEVNPLYYGTTAGSGHPGDQWGFVVGAGLKINFPMLAMGDYLTMEGNYTEGATRYLDNGGNTTEDILNGGNQAFGVMSDCVFGGTIAAATATGCNLTTGWSFNGGFEHYWTPQWHQSLTGNYMQIKYNSQANAILCTAGGFGFGVGTLATATPGCNVNWSEWGIGSRLQWDVTKTLYLGVEVIYNQLQGGSTATGTLGNFALTGAAPGTLVAGSESNWSFTARIHRDFLP